MGHVLSGSLARKITLDIPVELLEKAQWASGKGTAGLLIDPNPESRRSAFRVDRPQSGSWLNNSGPVNTPQFSAARALCLDSDTVLEQTPPAVPLTQDHTRSMP